MDTTIRNGKWMNINICIISIICLAYLGYVTHEHVFSYSCKSDFGYSSLKVDHLDSISLQPVNKHPYFFKILADSKCSEVAEIYLLILVRSATKNFVSRYAIRQTWGRESNSGSQKMVFLLGYNKETQDRVVSEAQLYNDVIQENFQDNYWSNPLKIEMAFNWITKYCSNARYSLFVDDDMYVNVPNALKYLESVDEEAVENLYSGYVFEQPLPVRFYFHKHYVSYQEYPFHCYPPFIQGFTMFFSKEVIQKMQKVMPYIPRYREDDVYIAIIAQKLGITPTKLNNLIGRSHVGPKKGLFPCLISDHGYTTVEMFQSAYDASHSFCDPSGIV